MHSPILEPWPVPPPAARSKSSKGSVDLSTVSSHHSPAFYVHPSLTPGHDPCKGRLLRTSSPVSAGTIILVDTPYAIVPTADPSRDDPLICSNLFCSRKVPQDGRGASCPRSCLKDVVWCNDACRTDDYARHQFECNWLKQKAADIRQVEGQYNFLTLWHVVRLLAARNLEMQRKTSISQIQQPLLKQDFKHGWEAVESCCAFLDTWPESQIRHWTRLTETYLCNTPELAHSLSPNEMLFLLCKEETNTFGLYPKLTGPEYAIDCCKEPRGISYAYCLYPRAAMFNHSCLPNVTHKPDRRSRMVYTAARDIAKGEECFITYMDLGVHRSLESRRKLAEADFMFTCTCERCLREEAESNLANMDCLPFGDF